MFELNVRAHLPVRGIIDECKIGQAQVLNKGETPQACGSKAEASRA